MSYYDTVNAAAGTLYFSTGPGFTTSAASTPPHRTFEPRLKQPARIRRDMFAPGTTRGRSVMAVGEMILTNTDGDLDGLLNYAFDGRAITVYWGPDSAVFPSGYTTMLVATMEQAEFTADEVRIRLRDRARELDVPLQATKYAGDNALPAGLEGVEDLKGKPKPWCFGDVFNVPAVCVNTSKLIYQVHDGAIADVTDVRDRGESLTDGGTYASEADLLDNALAPAAGAYKLYLAGGYFRLGSSPDGLVTADVLQGANAAARTAGQGFAAVMTKIGKSTAYSTSDVTTIDAARTDVLGFWSGLDEWKADEVIDLMAASVGAWHSPDQNGTFRFQVGPSTSGASVLTITQYDMLDMPQRVSVRGDGNGLPSYRVKIRYRKNYAVQSNDLAGAVTDANRALYSQEWREEVTTTSSVQTSYLLAGELSVDTLLTTSANASTESARRGAIEDSRQDRFEVPVQLNSETIPVDMGNVVTLSHPRWGLSAGAAFAVITVEPDAERNRVLLGCWRAA